MSMVRRDSGMKTPLLRRVLEEDQYVSLQADSIQLTANRSTCRQPNLRRKNQRHCQ